MVFLILLILLRARATGGALGRCDLLGSPEVHAHGHVKRAPRRRGAVVQTVWCGLVVVEQVIDTDIQVDRPVFIRYDRLLRIETP